MATQAGEPVGQDRARALMMELLAAERGRVGELHRELTEDEGEALVGEFVQGLDAFQELTDEGFEATLGVSRAEFETLHSRCEDVLTGTGRGKRTSITSRGMLVMLVFSLRTGWRQKRIAEQLGVGTSTVARICSSASDPVGIGGNDRGAAAPLPRQALRLLPRCSGSA
jgi:hypothetical protein